MKPIKYINDNYPYEQSLKDIIELYMQCDVFHLNNQVLISDVTALLRENYGTTEYCELSTFMEAYIELLTEKIKNHAKKN